MAEFVIDRAEELAEHQKASARRRRSEGRPSFSIREMYGFEIDRSQGALRYVIVPEEARMILWARDQLIAGASYHSICRRLNEPTSPVYCKPRRASMWETTNLRQIMIAARIAGCTEVAIAWDADDAPTEFELIRNTDGTLPAIITVEELLQLRERFRLSSLRAKGGTTRGKTAKHLLSGIARCPFCGYGLYFKRAARTLESYHCTHCSLLPPSERNGVVTSIVSGFLEEFVTGATLARVKSGAVAEILNQAVLVEGASEIAAQINNEESRLREFLDLAEDDPEVSARVFHSFTSRAEARISALKGQLSHALADTPEEWGALLPSDIAETVEAHWEEADLEFKRRLINLCFAKIIVHPSKKSGPTDAATKAARVELVPREAGGRVDASAIDDHLVRAAPVAS